MSEQDQPQLERHEPPERSAEGVERIDPGFARSHRIAQYLIMGIVILILAVVLVILWRATHHSTNKPTAHQPYTGQIDTITIANIGEYSIFNLIAKDKGFFADQGLKATVTEYPSGPLAMADLLAHKADFAVAADFVGVNNIFKTDQLRILSEASEQDNFRVIARKDHGIATQSDLKGKKIAVSKKTAGEFFLQRFLDLHGLSLSDVTEVDVGPADIITQLTNGQLDAAVIFEPHAYRLQQSLAGKVVSWSAQGDEKAIAVVYTTKNYIQAKPDVVVRYLKALAKAETFLKQHPQESKDILGKAMGYDNAYLDYMWPKFDFSLNLNQELLLTMEDQARFLIANHAVTQTDVPNYLDYIYFDGLQQAKPNAINVIDITH